jgi:WD40 repeat protein
VIKSFDRVSWDQEVNPENLYNSSGSKIYTFSRDSLLNVWDTNTDSLLYSLNNYSNISSFLHTDDDSLIVTSSNDKEVKIWDGFTGNYLYSLPGKYRIRSIQLSPNGRDIITISEKRDSITAPIKSLVTFWNLKSKTSFREFAFDDFMEKPVFCTRQKQFVTLELDKGKLWDENNNLIKKFPTDVNAKRGTQWNYLFSKSGRYFLALNDEGNTFLFDSSFQLISQYKGKPDRPYSSTHFNSSETKVLIPVDNFVCIVDTKNGDILHRLKAHSDAIISANFALTDSVVITTSIDNTCKIWESISGRLLFTNIFIDKTENLIVDTSGRFDGSPVARKLAYYVCGTNVIELGQLKKYSWEPDLSKKLLGLNKDPYVSKGLNEINICNYLPIVTPKGLAKNTYSFKISEQEGGIKNVAIYVNNKQVLVYKKDSLVKKGNDYLLNFDERLIEDYLVIGEQNKVIVKATTSDGYLISNSGQTDVPEQENKKIPRQTSIWFL